MRIAVFRAAADGARTAARLSALGHEAVVAPVIRIARTAAPAGPGDAEAVVFTSAHAPEVLGGDVALPDLRRLPCWCVGARTAAAARALGFATVVTGPGDGARLAEVLRAGVPAGARLLLLAGRDRKPDLERQLGAAGMAVRVVEVYRADAVPRWTDATVARLRGCEAALHYSRRSAELAVDRADAQGLGDSLRRWRHHGLSVDIGEALRARGIGRVRCAATPDEASLLTSLADETGMAGG